MIYDLKESPSAHHPVQVSSPTNVQPGGVEIAGVASSAPSWLFDFAPATTSTPIGKNVISIGSKNGSSLAVKYSSTHSLELAGGERPTIVIGGKGSSLSSADVYAVARGFRKVAIDPAALERFSRSQSPPPHPAAVESISKFLTSAESLAALVVLINKLVVSDGAVRPIFLSLIGEILGLQSGHSSISVPQMGWLPLSLS
ncbi:hypothetical protein KFK09_016194 [Dendrobium nobile]|uniref:Uncharacterized protein n=1 Tax=Dendrobium nobile TaxID=94219 RepID=A0A8T3AYU4_DENNO|nr:hypothetical protein KFK09_016194 [Dendrobium nobile]